MTPTWVVIGGHESPFPARDGGNAYQSVYLTMMLQIARLYPGLPDVRTMLAGQIRTFYKAIVPELKAQHVE